MMAQLGRFCGSAGFGKLARLARGEDGQDLIEYALLASLLSIVAALSLSTLGARVQSLFTMVFLKLHGA
jgi:Flp pilus assembly pilin Flp